MRAKQHAMSDKMLLYLNNLQYQDTDGRVPVFDAGHPYTHEPGTGNFGVTAHNYDKHPSKITKILAGDSQPGSTMAFRKLMKPLGERRRIVQRAYGRHLDSGLVGFQTSSLPDREVCRQNTVGTPYYTMENLLQRTGHSHYMDRYMKGRVVRRDYTHML